MAPWITPVLVSHRRHQVHDLARARVGVTREVALEQDREEEDPREYRGGDRGLDHPVGARQVLLANDLLDVAVLGRRVDGALGREQEGHGERDPEPSHVVAGRDPQCQHHRYRCTHPHHPILREPVGQETRGREQEHEGQQDQGIDDGREQNLGAALVGLEQGVLDDDLVPKVHEGIEEDHQDEGQKAGEAEELGHWRGSCGERTP
jgi:hypothetical protein